MRKRLVIIVLFALLSAAGLFAQGEGVSEKSANDLGIEDNGAEIEAGKGSATPESKSGDPAKSETDSTKKTTPEGTKTETKSGSSMFSKDQLDNGKPKTYDHTRSGNKAEETSFTDGIGQVFLYLAAFAVLITATVFFIRRTPRLRRMLSGGPIKVISRAYLGPKMAIHLVKVGERVLVVGQSPEGMRTLSEITEPGEISRLLHEAEEVAPESMTNTFKSALRSASGQPEGANPKRIANKTASKPSPKPASSFEATVGDDDDGAGIDVDPGYSSQLKLAALRAKLDKEEAAK